MTALVYSEGRLDLGDEEPFVAGPHEGPLRVLIKHVLDECDWLHIETRQLGTVHGDRESLGLRGYARKVLQALRDAQRDGMDAVFVVVDRDGHADRLLALRRGRDRAAATTPSAVCVAQEMVESWLMGDRDGWCRCFGADAPLPPADPEADGGSRASPRYAKRVLRELAEAQRGDRTRIELYTHLARHLDWKALAGTCHRSFAPFADEVRAVGRSLRIC